MDVTNKLGVRGGVEPKASNRPTDFDASTDKSSKQFAAIMTMPTGLSSLAQSQIHQMNKNDEFRPAAYREEGTAGHGNLIIEGDAKIQEYVADMPENFNPNNDSSQERRCKKINEGQAKEAIVCVGSNNNIPPEGDVDFVAVNDKWYKIRSGTTIVSKDPDTNETTIKPNGVAIGAFGLDPIPGAVHEVNKAPWPWSNPPKSVEPAQYLNRLDNEQGLAPLPIKPPPVLDSSI